MDLPNALLTGGRKHDGKAQDSKGMERRSSIALKVLLINPPRVNEITGNNPSVIEASRGCNPPLGLLYIGGLFQRLGATAATDVVEFI